MLAFDEEQSRLWVEAIDAGDFTFEQESMPDVYSTEADYSDKMLFAQLYGIIDAAQEYLAVLDGVIVRAKENLAVFSDMGINEDSFTYRYQNRVILLYEKMRGEMWQ